MLQDKYVNPWYI